MPRRARIALPNIPVHLIQRGNNRQACFFLTRIITFIWSGSRNMPVKPDAAFMLMF